MDETTQPRQPPQGLQAKLLRAPIRLYHLGLGGLLRGRFVLLHHIGRKTGLPREAVVEVVRRDGNSLVICSGFGEHSQWFQNVMAQPDITITYGSTTGPIHARRLTPADGGREMIDYAHRHPKAARRLASGMGFAVDGTDADYRKLGERLPFLRLEPQRSPSS